MIIFSGSLFFAPDARIAYAPTREEKSASDAVAALGHRRLSIINLSPEGHQPMCTADQHYWIVYNGEIYNYLALRADLELFCYWVAGWSQVRRRHDQTSIARSHAGGAFSFVPWRMISFGEWMKELGAGSKRLRILIVAHAFPPMNAIGSHRSYSWARFWRDEGHEIHVLTPCKHDIDGMMDLKRDLSDICVYEVPYLPMPASHPGILLEGTPPAVERWEWLKTITRRARFSLAMFGDPRLLAYRPMVREGMKIIRAAQIDFIIATSPPEVVFFVARTLSRRTKVPWVADFRDLWFRDMRLYQSRLASWLSGPVNSWLVKYATVMVTVSRGLQDRLSQYMGRDVLISYNGFFENDRNTPSHDQARNDGKLHIVYTGRFYPGKRDPEPLFHAMRSLRNKGVDPENRIKVDFYGFDDSWLRGLILTYELENTVCLHGFVPYSRSIEIQYTADVLLFLDWTEMQAEGILTGKLFEYLATGRPILSLGRRKDSEAAHVIAETGCGVTLTTQDEIEEFLLCLLASGRPPSVGSAAREFYSRERQARLLLEALAERVMSPTHVPMPYCGRGDQFE